MPVFQKVSVELEDSIIYYGVEDLKEVFTPYYENGKIHARWMSHEIRLVQGDYLYTENMVYASNYEHEVILEMKDGRTVHRQEYHNYVSKEGLTVDEVVQEVHRLFPVEEFSEYAGKRLHIYIGKHRLTPEVRLIYDESKINLDIRKDKGREQITDREHPLYQALFRTLNQIGPWKVYYLNGVYRAKYPGFSFWMRFPLTLTADKDTLDI